jgi:GGDEF domain-containing protein
MDVNKAVAIQPMGDAPGRQAGRQGQDSADEENQDAPAHGHDGDAAVALDGLPLDGLTPDVQRILDALSAQIEPMRREAEQAKAIAVRYHDLATRHPILAVPNRREFERELQHVIDHLDSFSPSAALVMINVTGAEALRGKLSRACADAAMDFVVEGVSQLIHPTDTIGSLCGYDLGVILLNGDADNVALRIQSIGQRLAIHPFHWRGADHVIEVHIGAAILGIGSNSGDAIAAADRNLLSK